MKKIETIWHHLLQQAIQNQQYKFTQQELAHHFKYSLSTVNLAISTPTQIGAIRKQSKFFILQDPKKLLYYWSSVRNITKDIIYQITLTHPIPQIEGQMIPSAIFGGYTAAKTYLPEPPADYNKVYIYLNQTDLEKLTTRFPSDPKGLNQLIILKKPSNMNPDHKVTTVPQTFVDIWNLSDWYAKDFIAELEKLIDNHLNP